MAQPPDLVAPVDAAYREGRMAGFAAGALIIAALSYINLLSLEKSLLAITLAWIALSHAAAGRTRTVAWVAIGIGIVHVVLVATVLILYHDKLVKLVQWLVSLG
jgi:hypothetical protein